VVQTFPGTQERILLMTGSISVVLTALHLLLGKAKENGAAALASSPQVRRAGAAAVDSSATVVRLVVPNAVCGAILGKGGDTLKSFIEDSGASIQVSSKDAMPYGVVDREVTISGSLEQAMRATALVASKMIDDPNYPALTRPLPVYSHGAPPPMGNSPQGHYHTGGRPARQSADVTMDDAETTSVEMQVPENQVGGIIGRGGATVREIESVTGVRIQIAPREDDGGEQADGEDSGRLRLVRITGTPDMVAAAMAIVKQKQNAPPPSLQVHRRGN